VSVLAVIRSRITRAHPDHHAIARGMAWVALFVFLGKLAGAAKEMAVAYRYGVGEEVDAYLFVLNLVSWPVGVWFSVLTVVLVPLAARIRQDATAELPRFRAELFGLALLIGVILAALAWLGLPSLLRARWTGLQATAVALASEMVSALVFLMPMGVITSLFSAWTLAAGRHANTLLEGVPALAIALAVLMLPGGGIEPLVWGTLAGFAFHLTSLAVLLAGRGEIEAPRFARQSPHWSPFWQGFGIMLAGQALMSFIGIIDQFFAAHFGTGAIATLGYANRILALIIGLGATAVGRATLPIFSKAEAQAGAQGHRLANYWVGLLFTFGVIAMIVGWGLAPWAVRLLFERGAFTAEDTLSVSEVLRVGLLQLPFYFGGLVIVSVLASQREHKLIAIGASVNLLAKVGANLALVPIMGVSGIMAATAVMLMVSFVLLWWFLISFTKQRNAF
jgi:putative peptidoglycan lipid II flippase